MKKYCLELNVCLVCPNYRKLESRDTTIDWCRAEGKIIPFSLRLDTPEWCPLPDIKETKKPVMFDGQRTCDICGGRFPIGQHDFGHYAPVKETE